MKRIYFWLKLALWVLIFIAVFIIFVINRESHVTVSYIFGSSTLNTSVFMFIIFLVGAVFTIGVLMLLNISRAFQNVGLKGTVKRLEKENAELKRKTHVL